MESKKPMSYGSFRWTFRGWKDTMSALLEEKPGSRDERPLRDSLRTSKYAFPYKAYLMEVML
jgi:hypothetical protein